MILDKLAEFCDGTALNTGGAATYLIGSQINLGSASKNLGLTEAWLVIRVETATTVTTTTGTLAFKLVSDDSASISTTTSTVHLVTATVTGAQAAGTTLFVGKLPSGVYEQYLGILQVTGTEATTAGKIDAFITDDPNLWKAYPDAL